jgi:hypothetical protein
MSAATRALILLAARPVVLGASPSKPAPDATSMRLCDALQALPERRKAECCASSPSAGVATACAQALSVSLRAKAITVDPADVDRCAAETVHALDGCDWVTPYLPAPPASCRGIVHGRVDVGGTCRSSLECRGGLHCAAGTCARPGAPAPPAAAPRHADDARAPDRRHEPSECTGYCFRGRCAAPVAAGGACSTDQQCAAGSHCAARRCVEGPRPALGEACDGTTCAGGLVCAPGGARRRRGRRAVHGARGVSRHLRRRDPGPAGHVCADVQRVAARGLHVADRDRDALTARRSDPRPAS